MYKQPININSPTAYVFWNLLAVIPPATDCERLCTHDQRLSLPLLNALHLILKRTCFSTAGIPLSQCLGTNDIEAKVTDRLTTTDILWDCKPARILRDMQTVLGERERVGFAFEGTAAADAAAACDSNASRNATSDASSLATAAGAIQTLYSSSSWRPATLSCATSEL
jgi:hypothetical protein